MGKLGTKFIHQNMPNPLWVCFQHKETNGNRDIGTLIQFSPIDKNKHKIFKLAHVH